MKTKKNLLVAILAIVTMGLTAVTSHAQESFSSKLGLFVYPANGQTKEQQEQDEIESYKWAVEQSGVDPLAPPQVEAEQVATGPDGGAAKGAAVGAAKGAAIGAVAGDAGKGAAVGATAGGMKGIGRSASSQQQAQQQAEADARAQEQALMDSFLRAYTVAMEGKGYTVSK